MTKSCLNCKHYEYKYEYCEKLFNLLTLTYCDDIEFERNQAEKFYCKFWEKKND